MENEGIVQSFICVIREIRVPDVHSTTDFTDDLAWPSRDHISTKRMATKSRKKTQKTDSDPEPFFVPFCAFL